VLLDLRLPDTDGVEACARVLHEAPELPLVVLTELADEMEAETAVMLGAHDYLIKGRFTAGGLGRSIRYAVERHRLQTQVEELSLSDALTGLSNRRGFAVRAEDDVRRARRSGTPFVLGVADVDGLTAINATHGRLEGDRAIREAAGILRRTFRDSDVVARVGGDEFAVLLREATPECAVMLADRLRAATQGATTSVGTAYWDGVCTSSDMLMRADGALYAAKRAGRNCVRAALENPLKGPPAETESKIA